jgi:hypothetical protein
MMLREGLIAVLWVLSAGLGGWVVISKISNLKSQSAEANPGGPLLVVTSAAVGLGFFSLAALLMGLAGALNRWTAMLLPATAVIVFAASSWRRRASVTSAAQRFEQWIKAPAMWGWLWLLGAPMLGLALAAASVPPVALWPGDPHPYDVLEYHLQIPREWYETGRITPLEHNVFSFFPFNSEMQFLLGMHLMGGPWKGMYLAHYLSLMQMALTVAAVWAAVRELRDDESGTGAVVAGVAAASMPWLLMLGTVAYNEAGLLLYSTLAVAWLARAVPNGISVRHGFIAGILAGLAAGTKYTAVPLLMILAPVLVVLFGRFRWRGIVAPMGIYLAGAMLMFGPWLAKNIAWTGNPVFPEAMGVFGRAHFSETQAQRWAIAHSPTSEQRAVGPRLIAFWREVLVHRGYGYALLPLGIVCGVASVDRRRGFLLANLAALAVFWLGLTHLQSRFFVFAIPLCAMLIGMAVRPMLIGIASALPALLALGLLFVHQRMEKGRQLLEYGVVAVEDLSEFLSKDVDQALKGEASIALVGDAQAFKYPIPMRCFRYRTVFDVNGEFGEGLIDAWLGAGASKIREKHVIVIVPDELRRLSRTYHGLPAAPDLPTTPEPLILHPGEKMDWR